MQDILIVWAEAFIRWTHVIAGVAWIGSSFYFMHLDYSLKQRPGLPDRAYGEAWQVHGGGFYHMVKYLVAPARMPDELTWFKWEAYATWFSGLALLTVVYYFSASLYMIDPRVMQLTPGQAVMISVATLVAGWVVYNWLCNTGLGDNEGMLSLVGFVFIVGCAWAFTKIFSARGAYMQIGALIGTIMAANVLMVIIPGQRRVIADLVAGKTPRAIYGKRGKQRSTHNNYLTLPLIFVMISNHYPLAYATRYSWVILALVLIMGAVIRHFYNTRHKGLPSPWWTWGVATACAIGVIWLSTFGPAQGQRAEPASGEIKFAAVEEIVTGRCSMCHAQEPVWDGIKVAPKGVMLDTPDRIRAHAREIAMNAVHSSAMPPSNVTDLTDQERSVLAAWVIQQRAFR